ncbi:hypothetical protein SAMN05216353_16512 [Halobacillus alkaliphilus]|uniref:Zinc-finger n=1 Tax=Halobacillus alkaliphilus TaxID=396056 RepID=A0A1I2TIB5_9BACI|nr:hypothetical protein [Halobacillus alkaliphilus]SFG62246.1 hypothetical protein SAMN05216353_16512 [Halobacillus alkaliphilus]
MNAYEKKIHKLSQELIPVFDELDTETKEIIKEHAQYCSECDHMLDKREVMDAEMESAGDNEGKESTIKSLKKLIHNNSGIGIMLFLVRVLVLAVISYNSLRFQNFEDVVQTFQGGTFLIYLPTAIFLLIFTWTFLNKRWILYSVVADLVVLLVIWQLPLFYKI